MSDTTNPRLNTMRQALLQEEVTIATEIAHLTEQRKTINEAIKVKRAELTDVSSAIKKLRHASRARKLHLLIDDGNS